MTSSVSQQRDKDLCRETLANFLAHHPSRTDMYGDSEVGEQAYESALSELIALIRHRLNRVRLNDGHTLDTIEAALRAELAKWDMVQHPYESVAGVLLPRHTLRVPDDSAIDLVDAAIADHRPVEAVASLPQPLSAANERLRVASTPNGCEAIIERMTSDRALVQNAYETARVALNARWGDPLRQGAFDPEGESICELPQALAAVRVDQSATWYQYETAWGLALVAEADSLKVIHWAMPVNALQSAIAKRALAAMQSVGKELAELADELPQSD